MARWITKNGRHIKINTNKRRSRGSYYPNYVHHESQRDRIQRELSELKARKESEMAKNALREGVSFIIRHIVPMIGPIIGDVIKLATLEQEHKDIEEQIKLIDSIKKGVDMIFDSKTSDPENRDKAILIRNMYQDAFVNTSRPNKGRRFVRALFEPTIFEAINGEFQTGNHFVEKEGIVERLSESNIQYIASKGADSVVECLIRYLNENVGTLKSPEKLEILSASLLEYCLKLQGDLSNTK